jgi:hypothetical protein
MLKLVAIGIATIDGERSERIRNAKDDLVDFVHEALWDHGIGHGPDFRTHLSMETYEAIQSIAAQAMMAQYEHDEEMWLGVLHTVENTEAVNADLGDELRS